MEVPRWCHVGATWVSRGFPGPPGGVITPNSSVLEYMNRFFLVRTKKKNSVPKKIILGFVPFSYKNLAKSCEIQEFPRKSVPTGVKIQGFWDVPGTKSWELHFVKVAGIIFFGTYQKKAVHVSRCVRPQFELNGAAGQLHISIATDRSSACHS